MFTARYITRVCPACGSLAEHLVCGQAGNRIVTCNTCQHSEDESKMKSSYKVIEHHVKSESMRKKRGIAVVERTTMPNSYFNGMAQPMVDTIEVYYPIWDDEHMTSQVQLLRGGHLDYTSSKAIAIEIDKLVKPVKEVKDD